jgi:hypothetical protein
MYSIIPKVKSLPWNGTSFRMFIEELNERRNEPIYSNIASPSVKEIIKDLTRTYAQKADLSAVTNYPRGYGYTGVAQNNYVLGFCLDMGGIECLNLSLSRVLDPKLFTEQYVSHDLLPLTTELRNLAKKHKLSMVTEPFASTVRTIMSAWLEKVFAAMPDPESRSTAVMAALTRYTCKCEACRSVRTFLTAQSGPVLNLPRIGAVMRRHVEAEINMYAREAATYTTIRGSPQGLAVSQEPCI